jgi:hypothetical protein
MFIGLNPSTADEVRDDPTIRRCIRFAKDWGYSAVCVANLFAYRATRFVELKAQPEPIGIENNAWLRQLANMADLIVAAWGVNGIYRKRDEQVLQLLPETVMCLRQTKSGQPQHPLYLPAWMRPFLYRGSPKLRRVQTQ